MFSGWAYADEITEGFTATDIEITGYLGDTFVGTTGIQSLDATCAFINGFSGEIDRLDFTTRTGGWWMTSNTRRRQNRARSC